MCHNVVSQAHEHYFGTSTTLQAQPCASLKKSFAYKLDVIFVSSFVSLSLNPDAAAAIEQHAH